MSINKLVLTIAYCFCAMAAANAKVAYVYSSKPMLEVNSIKYSNNGTTIVFFNCQSAPKCMYAVGDGGMRFKALSLSYAKEKGELSVTFEPIPFGNKAIDVVAHCDNLEEVFLPNSVEQIGAFAFYASKNLNHIIMPDGVKVMHRAFDGCSSLYLNNKQ